MSVSVSFPGESRKEMNMFAAADIDGTGRFSTDFMIMSVGKISAEFHFVEMILCSRDEFGFTGHGAEAVIMTSFAFLKDSGTAGDFVNMFLHFAVMMT